MAFYVNSASQFGAKHRRERWFLLAKRQGALPLKLKKNGCRELMKNFHQKAKATIPRGSTKWSSLVCKSYGNRVVPAQACNALSVLSKALDANYSKYTPTTLKSAKCWKDRWKPTVAISPKQFVQSERLEVAPADCKGGFHIVPARKPDYEHPQQTSPVLTEPHCIPFSILPTYSP